MNSKSISILGCGWLGLPLGEKLCENGYQVKGSTTRIDRIKVIKEKGIDPHLVIFNPDLRTDDIQNFLDSAILFINIPPKRDSEVMLYYPAQIKALLSEVDKSPIEKIIFISSTSVYGSNNSSVTEETELNPERDSGKALVIAEGLIRAEITYLTTIVRLGGLVGPDRHPGRFLAGRKQISGANAKVNLIHQADIIEILIQILEQNIWGEIFNAAADNHPTRKELYQRAAANIGKEQPEFINEESSYKIVSSEKLKSMLGYEFKYSNPLNMF